MSILKIVNNGDVRRNMLACAIDVSDSGTPEYVVVGYRITGSALELNADSEQGTDINGRGFNSVNKFEPTQSFEPHRLTSGVHGKLGEKLLHYFRNDDFAKFSEFKAILIYGFLESGTPGTYVADLYDACTVIPQSIGGESWADMPFEITFGGNKKKGTVDKLIDTVEFTPEA